MDSKNPYAPARSTSASSRLVRRDDGILVVGDGAELPSRCFKCNGPGTHRKTYKLSWHKPWLFALAVASPIVYVLVAQFLTQRISVQASLCASHRARVVRGWMLLALSLLVGPGLLFAGAVQDEAFLILTGVLVFVGALVGAVVHLRLMVPELIDNGVARIKGCAPDFLATLDPVGVRAANPDEGTE